MQQPNPIPLVCFVSFRETFYRNIYSIREGTSILFKTIPTFADEFHKNLKQNGTVILSMGLNSSGPKLGQMSKKFFGYDIDTNALARWQACNFWIELYKIVAIWSVLSTHDTTKKKCWYWTLTLSLFLLFCPFVFLCRTPFNSAATPICHRNVFTHHRFWLRQKQ